MIKQKILILGASSFGGLSATIYFIKNGYKVIGTYNKNKKKITSALKKFNISKKISLQKLDLKKDSLKIDKIVKKYKPSRIIDFASLCLVPESWNNPLDYFKVNVDSKIFFWKKLNSYNFLRSYIYISTPEIFGSSKNFIKEDSDAYNPSTPYALSKLTSEKLIRLFQKDHKKKKFIIARFSNFYGPLQDKNRLIPKVFNFLSSKKKFPLHGNGKTIRSFIYSEDFCKGIHKIFKKGKNGKTYHFTTNEFLTIKQLIKKVYVHKKKQFSKNVKIVPDRKGKDYCYKLSSKFTSNALNYTPNIKLKKGIMLYSNFNRSK